MTPTVDSRLRRQRRLPLLKQASVSLQQRLVRIIGTRSLGRSAVQLRNCESFTMPKLFNRTEANGVSAYENLGIVSEIVQQFATPSALRTLPLKLPFLKS